MKRYIFLLPIMLIVASCKTKTAPEKPISTTAPLSSTEAVFKKISEKADFQQLKINSKITAETGAFIPTLDATIYVEKDQKIWVNMIAIFLNVGRGIATPEGIKGYEKWNKTYIESDFSYLNNLLNVNFIDYNSFQNLLLGKTFIPVNSTDFTVTKNAQGYTLKSKNGLKFQMNGVTSEYAASVDYNATFDLIKINLVKANASDQLEVSYRNWTNFENMRVPMSVKIVIKGAKNSQILLENTKFESSKMQTPYSVPENYTKTEIK